MDYLLGVITKCRSGLLGFFILFYFILLLEETRFFKFISFCQTLAAMEPRISRPLLGIINEALVSLPTFLGSPSPSERGAGASSARAVPLAKRDQHSPEQSGSSAGRRGGGWETGEQIPAPLKGSFSVHLGGEFVQCPSGDTLPSGAPRPSRGAVPESRLLGEE